MNEQHEAMMKRTWHCSYALFRKASPLHGTTKIVGAEDQ
jgi:hypothetical protein